MKRCHAIGHATLAAAALVAGAALAAGGAAAKKQGFSCKRVAGQMQVRILELRGGARASNSAAEAIQSASVPLFGGSKRGTDAQGERQADIAGLKASNAMLKQENCPYFDLDAELTKPASAPTPKLIKPAKAAAKPKS